jgi:hypothetical protein
VIRIRGLLAAAAALTARSAPMLAQNALVTASQRYALASDSVVRPSTKRLETTRGAKNGREKSDPADSRVARVSLAAVTVAGKPGSLEVVGIPIPSAFANDSVAYQIVPHAGVRLIGRTEGSFVAGASRPSSLMITVSAPTSTPAGRVRVASARFDGVAGATPFEVPVEMTVLAVRRVEVTIVDQLVGARRGDFANVRYRAVNFGNVTDSVVISAELPEGWRVANADQQAIALPVRAAREGTLRLWIPTQAAPGTTMIRIIAKSHASVVAATDTRIEIENPTAIAAQQGPRLSLGSAFSNSGAGPVASAYMVTLDGQLSDSVAIAGRGSWLQGTSVGAVSSNLALTRVGVPMVPAALSVTAPAFRVGLGLTGGALSDLTGAYVTGTGATAGVRVGEWRVSGMAARPYEYGLSDTGSSGALSNARLERPVGSGTVAITATHISEPMFKRELDAASLDAGFKGTAVGDLSSELGYRRYSEGAGLGWSAQLQHQTETSTLSLRTMHAPGGALAYARATDDFSAAASRRLGDWASVDGAYWRTADGSSVFGTSNGSGWSAGPTFSNRSLGANLALQARGSSIDVIGQSGNFGSNETQLAATLDVRRGTFFGNTAGTIGRVSRSIGAAGEALPTMTGGSSDLRAAIGTTFSSGTVQIEGTVQGYSGDAGSLPSRKTAALRAEHIGLPVGERFHVYVGAQLERMDFGASGSTPLASRFSLTAPLGLGFEITASAERNPFYSFGPAGGRGWMTALRIDHSQYLPRLIAPGQTYRVFRDANGNGTRDKGEKGFAGIVVRCGSRTVATDSDGRFKCDASEAAYVDPRSLPVGWLAPSIHRERASSSDIGLVAVTAVRVQVDLQDVDTMRVRASDLEKLIVVARDTANQPWLARDLGSGAVVFDALPPGRYSIEVDVSAIEEPLRIKNRAEFSVGESVTKDLHVVLTGRATRIRVLPPTQSGGAGAGASDSTSRLRTGSSSSSKDKLR